MGNESLLRMLVRYCFRNSGVEFGERSFIVNILSLYVVCCPQIKKGFALREILDLREQNSPLVHTGQRSCEEPDFLTAMDTVQQSYTVCGSNTRTSSGKPPSSFFSEDGCRQVPCQNYCMLLLLHAHTGTHIHFLLLQRQRVPTVSLVFLTFQRLQKLSNMRGRREGFGNPAVS